MILETGPPLERWKINSLAKSENKKKNWEENQVEENRNNPKKLWPLIKELSGE